MDHPQTHGALVARLALVVGAVVLFLCTRGLPMDYYSSDARGTLLTSQVLVDEGTLRLDNYPAAVAALGYRVTRHDGHAYYGFPLGTPLLAAPVVAAARLAGLDMTRAEDDRRIQELLAGLLLVAAFLLVHALARLHLGPGASLAVALAFSFGTTLTTTLGSALWSQDATIVLLLAALCLLERDRTRPAAPLNPWALGVLVFLAALCRPTAALFAVLAAGYLVAQRPRSLWRFAVAAGVPTVILVAWSWRTFGQLLPEYYLPQRVAESDTVLTALVGNLISPARGFLVYNPLLALTLIALVPYRRLLRRGWLPALCLGWIVAHWLVVSRFDHWWGGHSFGNRLLADTLPAWALLTVVVVREGLRGRPRPATIGAWCALAGVGVVLHTGQGLHNPHTAAWNSRPPLDDHPALLHDWRFPQFLASERNLALREATYAPVSADGVVATLATDMVGLDGFYGLESDAGQPFRWTQGTRAQLELRAGNAAESLWLVCRVAFFGSQEATVVLNGLEIGVLRGTGFPPIDFKLPVPADAATRGIRRGQHEIGLIIPGAARPADTVAGSVDERQLGLAIYDLRLKADPPG